MKVKDLIKELKKFDQELEVGILRADYSGQDADFFTDIQVYEAGISKLYVKRDDYEIIKVDSFVALY